MCRRGFPLGGQVFLHRRLVKGVGLPLLHGDGVLRAFTEAGPETVAEVVGGEHCLAVDYLDGPLGAGGNAEPADVTFFRIDFDDFSQHDLILLYLL
jgi:hypothetical protein